MHLADPFRADLSGKQQAKSVPPKSNRLIADVDAAFVQQILHVPKRKRKPNIHHDGQTDDLGARLKVAKGAAFCHPTKLISRPAASTSFLLTVPQNPIMPPQLPPLLVGPLAAFAIAAYPALREGHHL